MRTHVRSLAFDLMLRWAAVRGCKRFLIGWNRGLGDIALGLYALVERIRQIVPGASISFVTRPDLYDGMRLLKDVDVQVDPSWVRGRAYAIRKEMQGGFDLVWEKPNPTQWLGWQLGRVTPRLQWQATQDVPCSLLTEEGRYVVGVHLHSETHYGYEKNWPRAKFEQLFAHLQREYAAAILLFGSGRPAEPWEGEGIVDLR